MTARAKTVRSRNNAQRGQSLRVQRLVMLHARQDALKAKWWSGHVRVMKESGQTMRKVRQDGGISLRALARSLGITAPFLSDMELGRRFYSKEWVSKALKALDHNEKGQP